MKIYLKISNGKGFNIPAPIGLVKVLIGLGGFGISIARRYVPKEKLQYVENIDFKELKKSMDVLKNYKGLKMLDIKTEDGTVVKIII